jgi:PadR family transcriptional regulator PadR
VSNRSDVLQGTLDLIVLRSLDLEGEMHGYGLARHIESVSEELLHMNQGTLYPALLRLQQAGYVRSRWGTSEHNRRARYYSLTPAGRRRLAREREGWERMSAVINRLLVGPARG